MSLRIVFFGTPAFAVPSLEALLASDHLVAAVVTQPDRPAGRGRSTRGSPIGEIALRASLPLLQPSKLRDGSFTREVAALEPDLGVVVAYGRILPPDLLAVPRLGHVNVHASLLPRHRGAAPIQHALLAGETVTGVSLMQLTEGLDEGPVFAARALEIAPDDDAGSLTTRLAKAGAELLLERLPALESGAARAVPQDSSRATHAPPIRREDARLGWSADASSLANRVRAMSPAPGAFASYPGGILKVHRARAESLGALAAPGTLLACGDEGPLVACGSGGLRLLEVQREGGRRQRGDEFSRGARLTLGERWT